MIINFINSSVWKEDSLWAFRTNSYHSKYNYNCTFPEILDMLFVC